MVYSTNEFRGKLRGNFLKTVLGEIKLFLIGDEDILKTGPVIGGFPLSHTPDYGDEAYPLPAAPH